MTEAPSVRCDYLDGVSSRRRPVTLCVTDGYAIVEGDDVHRREPLSSVRVSERMGGAARMVSFSDGAFCEVHDHDALDRLLESTGHRPSLVVRLQSRWRMAALALVLCAGVGVLGYVFALPWAADKASVHVPQTAVDAMSDKTLALLEQRVLEPSRADPVRADALARAFGRMHLPDGARIAHRVLFRSAPAIGPNAFALPSGTIIVTDGLLELTDRDEEVLAVLAHELGHVARRHGVRQVLQSSAVGLFVTWYLGDVSSLLTTVPAALLEARYSRELEREADEFAARMLRENAMSPELLVAMLGRLERAHRPAAANDTDTRRDARSLPDYLSTHPATDERISRLRRH